MLYFSDFTEFAADPTTGAIATINTHIANNKGNISRGFLSWIRLRPHAKTDTAGNWTTITMYLVNHLKCRTLDSYCTREDITQAVKSMDWADWRSLTLDRVEYGGAVVVADNDAGSAVAYNMALVRGEQTSVHMVSGRKFDIVPLPVLENCISIHSHPYNGREIENFADYVAVHGPSPFDIRYMIGRGFQLIVTHEGLFTVRIDGAFADKYGNFAYVNEYRDANPSKVYTSDDVDGILARYDKHARSTGSGLYDVEPGVCIDFIAWDSEVFGGVGAGEMCIMSTAALLAEDIRSGLSLSFCPEFVHEPAFTGETWETAGEARERAEGLCPFEPLHPESNAASSVRADVGGDVAGLLNPDCD